MDKKKFIKINSQMVKKNHPSWRMACIAILTLSPLNLLQHMVCQDALYVVDVHRLVELLFDAGMHLARNPNL